MARFYGSVGFAETRETARGVWEEIIIERNYTGDVIRNTRRLQPSEHLNDNISVNNQISILADPYAYDNFHSIRYVCWMNSKWKVSSVEVQYPRLILEIGGLYNEQS